MRPDSLTAQNVRPSLLLVEDDRVTAEHIIALCRERYPMLRVDFASDLNTAGVLLAESAENKHPYNAVVLDDVLPGRVGALLERSMFSIRTNLDESA